MIQFFRTHLKEQGYLFVALPKPDLAPLQLLIQDKNDLKEYDGRLLDLFEPDESPFPLKSRNLPDFSGEQLIQTNWLAGFNLLNGLFKLFQQESSKVLTTLNGIKGLTLSFAYENIEEERVSEQALDNFLFNALPKKEGFERSVKRLKNGELYVITSVLRSNQFTVSLDCSSEDKGKVEAALDKLLDIQANIERKKGNSFVLKTNGGQHFVFACRAAQIIYNKDHWFKFWKKDEKGFRIEQREGMIVRDESDFKVRRLQIDGDLLKLKQ